MKNKKIAIIGKGTAGSQAAAHFARFFPEAEIDWYFDPDKPAQSVGEGSTLELPNNLFNNLGFTHGTLKEVNGTFKTGIHKENWGRVRSSFFHDFPPPQSGYHFSAIELQEYTLKKLQGRVNVIAENTSADSVKADMILDASGKPSNLEEFYESEYIPVNAAYVVPAYWDKPQFDYTLTIASKHGWIFGIPLQNRLSVGYLYNSDISQKEDLLEEIFEIFDRYDVSPSEQHNSLSFKNYYRKNNFVEGGKIAYSGNASFFLEPLEATSISTMDRIQRSAFDVWSGSKSASQANKEYLSFMRQNEFMIMMHYAAGSIFDTPFWQHAQRLGNKKIQDSADDKEFKNLYQTIRNIKKFELSPRADLLKEYGSWWSGSFVQNFQGLGLYNILDNVFK